MKKNNKIKWIVFLLCCTCILFCLGCDKENDMSTPPVNLRINLKAKALGICLDKIVFSWTMQDGDLSERQTAYRIVIARGKEDYLNGKYVFDSEWVASSDNVGVKIEELSSILKPNTLYYWAVATQNSKGQKSDFSKPQMMFTELGDQWKSYDGIWSRTNNEGMKDSFSFLRKEIIISDEQYKKIDKVLLSVAARSGETTRQFVYSMYVNGESVGLGPTPYGETINRENILYYDTYDITGKILQGENCLSAINYAIDDRLFICQTTICYKDGSTEVLDNSGLSGWKAYGGNKSFGIDNSLGTGYYVAHANNIESNEYPFGFYNLNYDDSGWALAEVVGPIDHDVIFEPAPYMPLGRFVADDLTITLMRVNDNSIVIDLGKEIIGSLQFEGDLKEDVEWELFYGEQLNTDGSVKYQMLTGNEYKERWSMLAGRNKIETLDLMAFRYVQINGCRDEVTADMFKGIEIRSDVLFEGAFESSNNLLNDIYQMTYHTIKETSQELFVDSQSRERMTYEGDILINNSSFYTFSNEYANSRFSIEKILQKPTWPAEYILMASILCWDDYLETGDDTLLINYYERLKERTYLDFFNSKVGLVSSGNDTGIGYDAILIDWPETERDGYDTTVKYNTVFNAVAVKSYECLSNIALYLGKKEEAELYMQYATLVKNAMVDLLYCEELGAFCDGIDADGRLSSHYSQHATAYCLYAGIYDSDIMRNKLGEFIRSQGEIRMSVYGAYFLLTGLYEADFGEIANELLLESNTTLYKKTWAAMIYEQNATISAEAWNPQCKDNMTFSHPWGSAPASMIARGIFGIKPLKPGYRLFQVRFQNDYLKNTHIMVPTMQGNIKCDVKTFEDRKVYTVSVPMNTQAEIFIPIDEQTEVECDNRQIIGEKTEKYQKYNCTAGDWIFTVK